MADPKSSFVQRSLSTLGGLMRFGKGEGVTANHIRTAVKWYFDLMRNLLIAGGLKFVAVKTGSLTLGFFAELSFVLVWVTAYTDLVTWYAWPLHRWQHRPTIRALNVLMGLLLCSLLAIGTSFFVARVINELANPQSHSQDDRGRPPAPQLPRRRSNIDFNPLSNSYAAATVPTDAALHQLMVDNPVHLYERRAG
jgi:hypothetical protein